MKHRIYNNTLNPALWNEDGTLKQDVNQNLVQIARDFYEETHLSPAISDILLLGSSANYNWTPNSDIDVHVSIDFTQLKMSKEDAENYTNALKAKWNAAHDIHIKGHNVEMYIQDINHKTHALGIYSLLQNKWLVKPDKLIVKLDNNLIKQKYHDLASKISNALKSKDINIIKSTLKDVYDIRQSGLDTAGEFSTENIVFKLLRNNNYIDALKDSISKVYDIQHTMKES
jgi:predicted nucleotidyltransferase